MSKLKLYVNSVAVLGVVFGSELSYAEHGRQDRPDYFDTARVVDVRPLYRYVRVNEPSKECWNEEVVRHEHHRSSAVPSTVIGGVIGGVVGHQIGKGRGRDAATVVGALVGGKIGHDTHRRNNPGRTDSYVDEQRVCRRVDNYYEQRRNTGYEVVYEYNGRTYKTKTNRHPGEQIRVHVNIRPALD